MTNPIANVDKTGMLAALGAIPSSVGNNAKTESPFTTRCQILSSMGDVLKNWKPENGPKPDEGSFWFGPPGGKCMGKRFVGIPLATRDHALQTQKGNMVCESYVAPQSGSPPKNEDEKIFAQIQALPKQQPKEGKFNYWGADVLFWVPRQEGFDSGKFVIYFLHSTARPEVENCKSNKGKMVIVRSREIRTQYTWSVPEISASSAHTSEAGIKLNVGEFDPAEYPLPPQDEMVKEVTQFLNPISKNVTNSDGVDGRPR